MINFFCGNFRSLALEGYDLEHFLEINLEPPLKFLPMVSDQSTTIVGTSSAIGGSSIPNPEYKKWKR